MSTTSSINLVNEDGTIKSIYCHFDGDLRWVGRKLSKNYNTKELLNSLLELGDLIVLGTTIAVNKESKNWTWDTIDKIQPTEEECICLKDCKDTKPGEAEYREFGSFDEFLYSGWVQDYNYFFDGTSWKYFDCGDEYGKDGKPRLKSVKNALKNL